MNQATLHHYNSPQAAQRACATLRNQGLRIGYVPTMGALHPGHASLIQCARRENDRVVVSIFVNPLQFNNPDDLEKYPRNQEADIELLEKWQVDLLFTGTAEDFLGTASQKNSSELADPGVYAQGLEGLYRPGHFAGVREIVSRLFKFVGPCRAYFGEKDYQQLQIIRQLANALSGVEVIGCPTSREPGGLARSSRNQRLSPTGLQQAGVIYEAMQAANQHWNQGEHLPCVLQGAMLEVLDQTGIKLEYAEVRDPDHWTREQPQQRIEQARILIAAEIDGVRLIDNMALGSTG